MLVTPIVTGVKITQDNKLLAAAGIIEHDKRLAQYDTDGVEDLSNYKIQKHPSAIPSTSFINFGRNKGSLDKPPFSLTPRWYLIGLK